ncbi:4-(cytidine 5'-diphospho)-2-C-methyl-D-erythritol kinase [Deltaproteobacteria bacterium IMCC39524]|nr:4-(cytidine 5'-diphospho)-2-C-methyl-D-erythritol kinase [Deltaproteobacteria bacterium IMCC39524]
MKKVVHAPAKINLCLYVTGRREDGYHDLATLMQRVAIQDRLEIAISSGTEITVCCPRLVLSPGVENIAARAARLFLSYIGEECSVAVRIDKKIPAAAGMGGGSSNAASVLLALNDMLDVNLSQSEMISIGVTIGADVPFFLCDQSSAWATGVGERLQPWPGMPPTTFVLVNPGIEVSTAWVFKTLGLTCSRPIAKIPRFPVRTSGLVRLLHNDLEVVTCQRHPVITTIKERLLAGGAAGALMSGSGATVFGVFDDQDQAGKVAKVLSTETDWWVQVVNPL